MFCNNASPAVPGCCIDARCLSIGIQLISLPMAFLRVNTYFPKKFIFVLVTDGINMIKNNKSIVDGFIIYFQKLIFCWDKNFGKL